jgi:hypothetical protein
MMRVLLASLALIAAMPALAQEPDADRVEDVVVTAARSGAPIWRIDTPGGEVILVGSIPAIQADVRWRPAPLASAVSRADRIIMSQTATMSLGDYMRLRRNRARLPEGVSLEDVIEPDARTRLAVLEVRFRRNYTGRGLTYIAQDLLNRLDYEDDVGPSVSGAVERAASDNNREVVRVGDLNARAADENVVTPDATHRQCLDAAIRAAEDGDAGIVRRSAAWAAADIPGVLNSPLQQALDRCAFFGDGALQQEARVQWRDALSTALTQDGVTMIVASVPVVAEPSGLLDQAVAAGFTVTGPAWREE